MEVDRKIMSFRAKQREVGSRTAKRRYLCLFERTSTRLLYSGSGYALLIREGKEMLCADLTFELSGETWVFMDFHLIRNFCRFSLRSNEEDQKTRILAGFPLFRLRVVTQTREQMDNLGARF